MEVAAARAVLRVDAGADDDELRAAYRDALRRTHPDLHGGAGDAIRAVVDAYRLLLAIPAEPPPDPPVNATAATTDTTDTTATAATSAVTVDGGTVAAELPAGDLFAMLLDVGDRIGEVAYVDRDGGLLEVIVELAGYGSCSVVLTLQGRATGVTEAFCTVEPLGGGPAPPADEVAELLAGGLRTLVGRPAVDG